MYVGCLTCDTAVQFVTNEIHTSGREYHEPPSVKHVSHVSFGHGIAYNERIFFGEEDDNR